MESEEELILQLTNEQKRILQKASLPGSTILFNIKGMVQVLHSKGPFDFMEMGYDDIEKLLKKRLISSKKSPYSFSALHGQEFTLTDLGKKVAERLNNG